MSEGQWARAAIAAAAGSSPLPLAAHPKIVPSRLKAPTGTGWEALPKALRRCRESLSQKLKVPSEPVVAKVPYVGWKAMQLTE